MNSEIQEIKPVKRRINIFKEIAPFIVVTFVITIMSIFIYKQKETTIKYASLSIEQMAENAANEISSLTSYGENSVKSVAVSVAYGMKSPELNNPGEVILKYVESTPFDSLEYIRADGMNVMNIGQPFDASDREYYIEGIKGNTGVWNNYHPKISEETLVNFYTPLIYEEDIVGVITGYISASNLVPLLRNEYYGQEVYGLIIDDNGMIICSTTEKEYTKDFSFDMYLDEHYATDKQKQEIKNAILNSEGGAVTYKEPGGSGIVVVSNIPKVNWKVVEMIPASSFSTISAMNMRDTFIMLVMICVLIVAYFVVIIILNAEEHIKIAKYNEELEEQNKRINEENQMAFEKLQENQCKLEEAYNDQGYQLAEITLLKNRMEEQRSEMDDQFEILKSMSGMYDYINLLDFNNFSAFRFDKQGEEEDYFDLRTDPHTRVNRKMASDLIPNDYDRFWDFTDLSTLEKRLKGNKTIANDFQFSTGEWVRSEYIRIGADVNAPLNQVIYSIRNISKDKKREEQVYTAISNLLYSLHVFDLENDTIERLIESDILQKITGNIESAQRMSNTIMKATSKDEYLDLMLEFVDLSTVSERMKDKKFISCEFVGKFHGWTRMTFIPIEIKDDHVKKIVVTTQIIDSEKNEMINLMYKSNTDELTRLYNRRMYEEELDTISQNNTLQGCIIVAMDVNGLKKTNDSLGHKAGDELIIGAGECMKKSFRTVGKVYRTGGDEFMAILRCDEEKLQTVLTEFDQFIADWKGKLVDNLSISYGYVLAEDYPNLSVRDLASEADKRMYEAKSAYYRQKGIERRRNQNN